MKQRGTSNLRSQRIKDRPLVPQRWSLVLRNSTTHSLKSISQLRPSIRIWCLKKAWEDLRWASFNLVSKNSTRTRRDLGRLICKLVALAKSIRVASSRGWDHQWVQRMCSHAQVDLPPPRPSNKGRFQEEAGTVPWTCARAKMTNQNKLQRRFRRKTRRKASNKVLDLETSFSRHTPSTSTKTPRRW